MITVESLTRRYAGFTAVDNVTFSAQPGRVTGCLGPNGAGKSTTMRMMVGLTVPTSGSATINGVRFADLPHPGSRDGCVLLDASAQHAGRTGHTPLEPCARGRSCSAGVLTRVEELVIKAHGFPYRLVTHPGDRSHLIDERLVVRAVADRAPVSSQGYRPAAAPSSAYLHSLQAAQSSMGRGHHGSGVATVIDKPGRSTSAA